MDWDKAAIERGYCWINEIWTLMNFIMRINAACAR